jgi:formate dehydrogenase major subunit
MLRKKTSGVARGPQSSSFIGKAAETVVDRRAFLRGSGLAIGGLATAAALVEPF